MLGRNLKQSFEDYVGESFVDKLILDPIQESIDGTELGTVAEPLLYSVLSSIRDSVRNSVARPVHDSVWRSVQDSVRKGALEC